MQGNEESPSEEEDRACKVVVVAEDDQGMMTKTARGKHVRSDVAILDPLKMHQIRQILENLQSPTFEK